MVSNIIKCENICLNRGSVRSKAVSFQSCTFMSSFEVTEIKVEGKDVFLRRHASLKRRYRRHENRKIQR